MVMVVRVRLVDRWLGSRTLGAGLGGLFRLVAAGGLVAALVAGVLVAWAPVTDAAGSDSLWIRPRRCRSVFVLRGCRRSEPDHRQRKPGADHRSFPCELVQIDRGRQGETAVSG